MRRLIHFTAAALLAATTLAAPLAAQDKKRIAIMDFSYGTVQTSVQAVFGANQDIGKGRLLPDNPGNRGPRHSRNGGRLDRHRTEHSKRLLA